MKERHDSLAKLIIDGLSRNDRQRTEFLAECLSVFYLVRGSNPFFEFDSLSRPYLSVLELAGLVERVGGSMKQIGYVLTEKGMELMSDNVVYFRDLANCSPLKPANITQEERDRFVQEVEREVELRWPGLDEATRRAETDIDYNFRVNI